MKGTRFMTGFSRSTGCFLFFSTLLAFLPVISCTTTPDSEQKTDSSLTVEEVQQETENSKEFKVTEDVYSRTFSHITILIDTLNSIIRSSKFDEWKKYLTKDNIDYYISQENLKAYNETPILKKHNI
ncbi:MAG: hypothetical protein RBT69_12060, partial [Spirochaetia bacterium]|nr:hypothetical protein [Spirochaetia bacterium]